MAAEKGSCAGFVGDRTTHEASGGAAAVEGRAWGESIALLPDPAAAVALADPRAGRRCIEGSLP